jgi:hypothetical protein
MKTTVKSPFLAFNRIAIQAIGGNIVVQTFSVEQLKTL